MHMPQGHIVHLTWQNAGIDRKDAGTPFPSAKLRARNMGVSQHDGHRIAVHPQGLFFQFLQIALDHALVGAQAFALASVGSFGCGQHLVGVQIGQTPHQRPLSSGPLRNGDNQLRRVGAQVRHHVGLEQIAQRLQGAQAGGVIVVAGNDDGHDILAGELGQGSGHQLLGGKRRALFMKNVAGDQHGIDLLALGNIDKFGKYGPVFIHPGTIANRAADVPVRGVQKLHAP